MRRRKGTKLSLDEAGSGVALGGDNVVGSKLFPPVGSDLRESASTQGGRGWCGCCLWRLLAWVLSLEAAGLPVALGVGGACVREGGRAGRISSLLLG